MVRCKFRVWRKLVNPDGTASISMSAVGSGSPENDKFFKYTPGGELSFCTVNAEAAAQLEEGKEYYIDISLAETAIQPLSSVEGFTFGDAFEAVKRGKGMRLPHWNDDVVIRAQYPDEHSKMTAPYLFVESRFGRVPWKETMIELFAVNWQIVE